MPYIANVALTRPTRENAHPRSAVNSSLVSHNGNAPALELIRGQCKMDSTDHKHLQCFSKQRKQNKTIGLHKKEYI